MNISFFEFHPHVTVEETDAGKVLLGGMGGTFINTLMAHFNITPNLLYVAGKEDGYASGLVYDNGSLTGAIKEVASHKTEISANMDFLNTINDLIRNKLRILVPPVAVMQGTLDLDDEIQLYFLNNLEIWDIIEESFKYTALYRNSSVLIPGSLGKYHVLKNSYNQDFNVCPKGFGWACELSGTPHDVCSCGERGVSGVGHSSRAMLAILFSLGKHCEFGGVALTTRPSQYTTEGPHTEPELAHMFLFSHRHYMRPSGSNVDCGSASINILWCPMVANKTPITSDACVGTGDLLPAGAGDEPGEDNINRSPAKKKVKRIRCNNLHQTRHGHLPKKEQREESDFTNCSKTNNFKTVYSPYLEPDNLALALGVVKTLAITLYVTVSYAPFICEWLYPPPKEESSIMEQVGALLQKLWDVATAFILTPNGIAKK
uniref:Uncharacterized protein n=1 Tax=Timema cristinae TaxID=61476 RepID=A0A7R9CSI9_TIMCR|nr:unnamed protein product [Timema cristinae]